MAREYLTVRRLDELIKNLLQRIGTDRNRILRKIMEELGEYAEALEYNNGCSRKAKKFEGGPTPREKLREEIADLFMVVVALARLEGLGILDVGEIVVDKLSKRKREHEKKTSQADTQKHT